MIFSGILKVLLMPLERAKIHPADSLTKWELWKVFLQQSHEYFCINYTKSIPINILAEYSKKSSIFAVFPWIFLQYSHKYLCKIFQKYFRLGEQQITQQVTWRSETGAKTNECVHLSSHLESNFQKFDGDTFRIWGNLKNTAVKIKYL